MKNILEKDFKKIYERWKICKIIRSTNNLLTCNLEEKEVLNNINSNFNKLLRYSNFSLSKLKTKEDFEEFILWFSQIIKDLEIEKLYNTTNSNKLTEFDNLDLFMQFFYISTPLYNDKHFDFIKWWVCYHWSLFFYNLFNTIDKTNILEKKFISYKPDYNHSAFLVWFKWKKYIIDPYAKSKWLLTEIKKWNNIYLSIFNSIPIYWKIEDEKNIKLKINKKDFNPIIYTDKKEFIKNHSQSRQLVNLKTYIKWEPFQVSINVINNNTIINIDWHLFQRNKEFMLTDLVWLYLEWNKKINNQTLLFTLLWFDKDILNKNLTKRLNIIADLLDFDYILNFLWIKEDITIVKSMSK